MRRLYKGLTGESQRLARPARLLAPAVTMALLRRGGAQGKPMLHHPHGARQPCRSTACPPSPPERGLAARHIASRRQHLALHPPTPARPRKGGGSFSERCFCSRPLDGGERECGGNG